MNEQHPRGTFFAVVEYVQCRVCLGSGQREIGNPKRKPRLTTICALCAGTGTEKRTGEIELNDLIAAAQRDSFHA